MTAFLSADWFAALIDASAALPEVPGASAELEVTVPKAPAGDVRVRLSVVDGRLVAAELDADDEVALRLVCPHALAIKIAHGEVSPAVAFMQGELKVTGHMGAMHRVLPLTADPAHGAMLADLSARTDF